ncbi:hypothetical protein BDP55DRAFT_748674 [Colletotrichum godetiae]|uniref:Uncharacterized protein n=1 Tax=Colletotrichum godetiae TaxID=1209918 RepID=A0AAJ0ER90_9PEZI|nr:uncharacterized protein BDP55DRAFT_748674 [Colletotrichum godetiae]KAK1673671.1 hypothetical protein BDP55DRAFT_748674 [Colletotrichum godetiae]
MGPELTSSNFPPLHPAAGEASVNVSFVVDKKPPPANITSLPNEIHDLITSNLCEHCTGGSHVANPDRPSHTNSADLFQSPSRRHSLAGHCDSVLSPFLRSSSRSALTDRSLEWSDEVCRLGTGSWAQLLHLQTPNLEGVSIYKQSYLPIALHVKIKSTFLAIRRNMGIPTMLICERSPRFPHYAGAIHPERFDNSILSPADNIFDLYNIAFSSLSRHCGGIEEIQHVQHLHTVDHHLDKWPMFTLAPGLKRLRLGLSCLKYWEEDWPPYAMHNINTKGVWRNLGRCLQRLIDRIMSGDLPHFRSLHTIDKFKAIEPSSEKLVVTTKVEELGVELKFYEQDVRNNVDFAGVEDEGWTLHDNIGGSHEFVVAAKRVSTRGSGPRETLSSFV